MTKKGVQMKALKAMLERVTEPLDAKYDYSAKNLNNMDDFETFMFQSWRYFIASPDITINIIEKMTFFAFQIFFGIFGITLDYNS